MNKKLVSPILIAIGLIGCIASAFSAYNGWVMHGTGNVSMIKVYFDDGLVTEAKNLDFGSLQPGSTSTLNLWVKNYGPDLVVLTLSTTNWSPANAGESMLVAWDREGESIVGNAVLSCAISLQVYENITLSSISSFSFDTTVSGSTGE